ncbi:alpha/beta fold hydrolase [Clostridium vincentii]|uniref:Arylesterase n=1 Tax=Clostridium vincentii TaxID=52704 RepID=A0A2T0BID3_9CLOT|nr:alpha/beta hydrolase [Clostridium vincentii]PRR83650.1 Arylesterase [Clostridium vincentii]
MENEYIRCNSANIYYEVHGEGEPILCLHGNGEDSSYFKPQIREFSKKYKVIVMDSRGHGKSSFGEEGLSLELMAKDVLKVIKELNIDKIHLLGFSDGGNVALKIAMKNPKKIKTLSLVGANLQPKDIKMFARIPIVIEYGIYSLISFNKKKEIIGLMIKEPCFKEEELKTIFIPTLVIAGENDLIKESCTKLISKSINNSKLVIIKGGDHFVSSKKSGAFNKIFLDFIRKN